MVKLKSICLFLICVLMTANTTFAGAGGEHHSGVGSLLYPAINFTLYIITLYYFVKDPIAEQIARRIANIREGIREGEIKLQASQQELAKAQELYARLEDDKRELAKRIELEAKEEAEEIEKEAEEKGRYILAKAVEAISAEEKASLAEVREEALDLVMKRARDLLSSRITKEKDKSIRENNIQKLNQLSIG